MRTPGENPKGEPGKGTQRNSRSMANSKATNTGTNTKRQRRTNTTAEGGPQPRAVRPPGTEQGGSRRTGKNVPRRAEAQSRRKRREGRRRSRPPRREGEGQHEHGNTRSVGACPKAAKERDPRADPRGRQAAPRAPRRGERRGARAREGANGTERPEQDATGATARAAPPWGARAGQWPPRTGGRRPGRATERADPRRHFSSERPASDWVQGAGGRSRRRVSHVRSGLNVPSGSASGRGVVPLAASFRA